MKQHVKSLLALPLAALLATAAQAQDSQHTVKPGETLGGIANRAGVSMSELAKANGLKEPYALRAGQKLRLPGKKAAAKGAEGAKASGAARASDHIVKPGETLNGIANRAGVSPGVIIKANGLKEPYALRVGQKLSIPGGKGGSAAKPATPSSPAAVKPSSGTAYVVQPGETLNGIANRAGVSPGALARANGLKEPYALRAGQKLAIPGGQTPVREATAETESESEHVVQPGETLGGIANRAGVPRVLIAEANGLAEPYEVQVGQKLLIPRRRTHTVKEGETGFGIAYQYGVPFSQIAVANGLEEDAVLKTGQKLVIPTITRAPLPKVEPAPPTVKAPAPIVKARPAGAPDFRWPLGGSVIVGYAPSADASGHDGIDISAKAGTAVRASAAGMVLYAASEAQRYGNLVIVDHGNGWYSAYGHLATIAVDEGAQLRAGAALGTVGQSGSAKQPQLHFEIRKDNKPVDPRPLLGVQSTP